MKLIDTIGLGVAGNFTNHLKQAGELKDFENVKTEEENAPKGIFPFYLPHSETFLGVYPVSDEKLELPTYEANAQVEPEIVVYFEIVYNEEREVTDLVAKKFTTFNDCTIRKDGAKKISEKKSWSPYSKGIAKEWIDIDKFDEGGVMDNYHLCSYVKRDGTLHPYGVDAPLLGYSYFYTKLKKWLIDKMNNQADFGPLEDISEHLKNSNYPKSAIITIGATAYEKFGEENYLKSGDEIFVIAYNKDKCDNSLESQEDKIILHQKVL